MVRHEDITFALLIANEYLLKKYQEYIFA
jgi:hypothetical protein